jgi:hypothetical protein
MRMVWIAQLGRLLRGERVAAAQSYEEARAQLDGAVSRERPPSTDRWFIIDASAGSDVGGDQEVDRPHAPPTTVAE